MKKRLKYLITSLLLILITGFLQDAVPFKKDLASSERSNEVLVGTAVKISDGDTIVLLDSLNQQHKIRLHGIDCPERGQDFGKVATEFTAKHCADQTISVTVLSKDRYGRQVGIVSTNKIENLNLALLQAGLAWHYTQYDKSESFSKAENLAKEQKLGLWIQPNAVAPWEFRKRK